MRRLFLLALLTVVSALACAGSTADYLKLRRAHHVTAPTAPDRLTGLIGGRVLEISGTVKGSFRVGEAGAIMVQRPDGNMYTVDCQTIPEWLTGNEVQARLLVKASRATEGTELKLTLLGAAPEADVAAAEKRAATSPKRPATTSSRLRGRPLASRKGSVRRKEWVLPESEVTPIYANFIKSRNRRLSDAQAMEIAQGIVGFSLHYGVDARLIMAMVMVESGFNPGATSRVGAMGLGQLMPGTAQGLGVSNAYDTNENLYGAVKLLRGHLDKYRAQTGRDYDSLVLALAAYNAGGGAVRRHGGVPPYRETQNYVRKVIGLYYAFCGYA